METWTEINTFELETRRYFPHFVLDKGFNVVKRTFYLCNLMVYRFNISNLNYLIYHSLNNLRSIILGCKDRALYSVKSSLFHVPVQMLFSNIKLYVQYKYRQYKANWDSTPNEWTPFFWTLKLENPSLCFKLYFLVRAEHHGGTPGFTLTAE